MRQSSEMGVYAPQILIIFIRKTQNVHMVFGISVPKNKRTGKNTHRNFHSVVLLSGIKRIRGRNFKSEKAIMQREIRIFFYKIPQTNSCSGIDRNIAHNLNSKILDCHPIGIEIIRKRCITGIIIVEDFMFLVPMRNYPQFTWSRQGRKQD